eukprot:201473_1
MPIFIIINMCFRILNHGMMQCQGTYVRLECSHCSDISLRRSGQYLYQLDGKRIIYLVWWLRLQHTQIINHRSTVPEPNRFNFSQAMLSPSNVLRRWNPSLICNYYVRCISSSSDIKPRILFVCVANSCRSQLAEVLGKKHLSDIYDVYSAGSTPTTPNPLVLQFLQNKGYTINDLYSKSYADIPKPVDIAITLCEESDMECKGFFDQSILQRRCWKQRDPVKVDGTNEDKLEVMETVWNNVEKLMIDLREETTKDLKAH